MATEKTIYLIKCLGLFAIYIFALIVIFLRPLDVQHWQWADDALYFNNARSIISNIGGEHWLGSFNKVVISKAPFFPVFIATIHSLGIPLRFAEFFLFAPLPFLFRQAVRPLQISKWITIYLAALCVVCIPIAGFDSRLLRTTLFGALSLYCLTSLIGIITRSLSGQWRVWPWAVAAGLALGLAATTREDSSWLMLPVGITILSSLFIVGVSRRLSYYTSILSFIGISIGYLLPVILFSMLNYRSYGVYASSLRQNSAFRAFYATLCSLQPAQRQKYVPINTMTRELAYGVSPHFAKLKPYLEGPALDDIARNKGHLSLNRWENLEGREFFVSNFEFALADAIILSGHQTGQAFLDFCRQATKEIRTAIYSGKIEQGKAGFSMLPPLEFSEADDILVASIESFTLLLKGKGQHRDLIIQTEQPSNISTEWHSFLMTWPYPPAGSERFSVKLKNYFFKAVVNLFKMSYLVFLILGLAAGGRAFMRKYDNHSLLVSMLLVSWSAFFAFCITMGVVDTIAFPTLQWPEGYNIAGFFPLHFLLLVSGFALVYILRQRSLVNPLGRFCTRFHSLIGRFRGNTHG